MRLTQWVTFITSVLCLSFEISSLVLRVLPCGGRDLGTRVEDWFIGCMNNWTVGRAGNKTITFTPYTCTPSHSSPNSSEKLRASREAQRKATHNEGTVEGGEGGGEVGGLIVFWAERQTARSSVYLLTVLSLKVLNLP